MNETINANDKKNNILPILKRIFFLIFPIFKLIKYNSLLRTCNEIERNSWYEKTIKKNFKLGLIASVPFLITSFLNFIILIKDEKLIDNLQLLLKSLKILHVVDAYKIIGKIIASDSMNRIIAMSKFEFIGIAITMIFSTILMKKIKYVRDSDVFRSLLKSSNIIAKDDDSRMVLGTPFGYLMDVTNVHPDEIKNNKKIWMSLNMNVHDVLEHPKQRSIVFFQKTYELQKKYIYQIHPETKELITLYDIPEKK